MTVHAVRPFQDPSLPVSPRAALAIKLAGNKLALLHASGSDRKPPAMINWGRIFAALDNINYQGNMVIESFTPHIKIIAKAVSIWRQVELPKEEIAVNGLRYLLGLVI